MHTELLVQSMNLEGYYTTEDGITEHFLQNLINGVSACATKGH